MNRANLVKLGCGAIALTIGIAAGSYHTGKPEPMPAAKVAGTVPAPALAAVPGLAAVASVEFTPARTVHDAEIEEIKVSKGARRWLLLLAAAEKATAGDMPALIYSVGPDSVAIRMLAARWAQLDPMHMFKSIYADSFAPEDSPGAFPYRSQLQTALFDEWAKIDLAGAVKALSDAGDFSGRESYRVSLVNATMKEDVEQGLRLMKEWQIRGSIPSTKKVAEWAASDPKRAAQVVLELGSDYAGQQALREVGKAWAQVDPEGGLRFAASLDPNARAALGYELMQQWAQKSPTEAAAFAAAQGDMTYRATLAQGLVSTWGATDPTAALAWSQQHLRGSARTEAVAGVIRLVAERSLTEASQIVADMEPGGIQNRACGSIFEAWFNKGPSERTAAFEWLASLPDEEARRIAVQRVQWNGAFRDPETLRDFLAGPHGDLAPDYVVAQLAGMQAAKDPDAAMKWASTLPANRAATARMGVLSNWIMRSPEQAQAYVLGLPSGSERQEAVRTVSMNIAQQSVERTADWYRTLPSADREVAKQAFQRIGLSVEQRQLLEESLKE